MILRKVNQNATQSPDADLGPIALARKKRMENSLSSGEHERSASEKLLFEKDPYQEALNLGKQSRKRDKIHKSNSQASQTVPQKIRERADVT